MTIIAYRNGVMAADSCAHDAFVTNTQKLFRVKGAVIGFCGDVTQALVFVDWFASPKKARRPDIGNETDWEALVLTKDGVTQWERSLRPVPMNDRFYAIGTGAELAIGAMEHGATAKEAAVIACRRNPYCREPVTTMKL